MSKSKRLTAKCLRCGETVKQIQTNAGVFWHCLSHGYATDELVTDIGEHENPTYRDGSPVRWLQCKPQEKRETSTRHG